MKTRAVFAIPVLLLSACGMSDAGPSVSNAWARTSAPGQTLGALYFDVTVDENDRLISASVPTDIAAGAEIHEVVMADAAADEMSAEPDEIEMSAGSSDMDMADSETSDEMGAMRMQEMPNGLALTAGEMVSFEPGNYHVMLPELARLLEPGDEFELILDFEKADDVTVSVVVADTAP